MSFEGDQFQKWDIKVHSEEWFKFRTTGTQGYEGGFGASEVAKFIGFNDYEPVAPEVFYHKVGISAPNRFSNQKTFWGTRNEDRIIDSWQFQEGVEEGSYVDNYTKYKDTRDPKYIQRVAVDVPYYLVNKKYPWLFASLDAGIAEGSPYLTENGWAIDEETGELLKTDRICPLECKNMGGYALKSWEGGMNPTYIAQVHAQMIVTESVYSEIVVLVDGSDLRIIPVYLDPELAGQILESTKRIWENVLIAREIWKDYHGSSKAKQESIWADIMSLEPEVSAGKAYREWLKEHIKNPGAQIKMNTFHVQDATAYSYFGELEKHFKKLKEKHYNVLLNEMRTKNVGKLDGGKKRSIGYNKESGRMSIRGISKTSPKELKELIKRLGIGN